MQEPLVRRNRRGRGPRVPSAQAPGGLLAERWKRSPASSKSDRPRQAQALQAVAVDDRRVDAGGSSATQAAAPSTK